MKFDKKVMESGVVAAFSLVLALTAVPVTGVSTEADLDSRKVELTAEAARKYFANETATKVKRESNLVAAASDENQPLVSAQEEKAGQLQQYTQKETAQENQPQAANLLAEAIEETTAEAAQKESVQEPAQGQAVEEENSAEAVKEETGKEETDKRPEDNKETAEESKKEEVSPWDTK